MKLKQVPEDFIVDEIYNLDDFKGREEDKGHDYYYFKLTKTNYTQMKALDIISRIFKVSRKMIHFAGTKDRNGITSQLISVTGINKNTYENNIEFLNEKINDINLEFLGIFKGRINLGDNLGNKFQITIRDLETEDILKIKTNSKDLEKNGVLNYFDDQRFGFANNSHKIGLFILKNDLKSAVFEVLTSLPENPSDNLREFVEYIENNKEKIIEGDKEIISSAMKLVPKFFSEGKAILAHLHNYKGDYPGAFRTIHKKLRTLYFNAYQSYLFNETIDRLNRENKLDNYKSLPLISKETVIEGDLKAISEEFLQKDGITQDNFNLAHMPELKPEFEVSREIKIYPKNFKIVEEDKDELNEDKLSIKIEFELVSGSYATNVIKQLLK
jgi:tRNA pseudouridine13 synthase